MLHHDAISEILTLVKTMQGTYVDIVDYQLFVANTIEKWSGFYLKT